MQTSNGLLDSESEDEETMFDFQSQDERQIGKHISMLLRWIAMVSEFESKYTKNN